MNIFVDLGKSSYNITVRRGCLTETAETIVHPNRKICVVTDNGVPRDHIDKLLSVLGENVYLHILPAGEENKTFNNLADVLRVMLTAGFTRSDAVVALGGGVVGDLAGFAAATYMRGVDFYNIPTTLLSQLDSSVGGKTAVDLDGYKNIIGAFHQPRAVFIDPSLLSTLPRRHVANGLCEAVKIAATSDCKLFEIFEKECVLPLDDADTQIRDVPLVFDEIIIRAVTAKRDIVVKDERESGLRKVLNFGHTLGHAIESVSGLGTLLHGECVALGMPSMCDDIPTRKRIVAVLGSLGLPCDVSEFGHLRPIILEALGHDKKGISGGKINTVVLDGIGKARFVPMTSAQIMERAFPKN